MASTDGCDWEKIAPAFGLVRLALPVERERQVWPRHGGGGAGTQTDGGMRGERVSGSHLLLLHLCRHEFKTPGSRHFSVYFNIHKDCHLNVGIRKKKNLIIGITEKDLWNTSLIQMPADCKTQIIRQQTFQSPKCDKSHICPEGLYLSLRISLWWDTARGVVDAVIVVATGRPDRPLPPATGRSIIHLPTQSKPIAGVGRS